MQSLQSTLYLKHSWCQHDEAAAFSKTSPTTPVPQHCGRRRQLPSKVGTYPSPRRLVPPFLAACVLKTRALMYCHLCSTAQCVWGKYPTHCLCSGGPSSQRNNKRAFGQECKYFLLCWMQMGKGNITGHGCEKKRADGRLCSSAQ